MSKPLSEMSLEELWTLFPICLTEHKEYWVAWYEEERTFLLSFLPENVRISHIGSTAIKGIWAKPIIDILAETDENQQSMENLLLKHGYLCMARCGTRMDFNKGYTPRGFAKRVFHLHLREYGDHDELYFRDYLNGHPEIAKEYEKLKLSLRRRFEHDRDGYTEGKTDFVREYTQKAKAEYGPKRFA